MSVTPAAMSGRRTWCATAAACRAGNGRRAPASSAMERKRRLRGRSLGVRHAGKERHLAVERRAFAMGTMKGSMLAGTLRLGKRTLTDRAGPHMRIDGGGLVDFESAKDIASDEIVDMPNVICG